MCQLDIVGRLRTVNVAHLVRRGEGPENAEKVLTLHRSRHFLAFAIVCLDVSKLLLGIEDAIPHISQLLLGRCREAKHLASVTVFGRRKVGVERFTDVEDLVEHRLGGRLHVVEVDSVGLGWCSELIEKGIEVRKVSRHDVFEEVEQILAIGRFGVDQLKSSVPRQDSGDTLTYPVDTGHLEPKGPSGIVGPVQVIAHDQNDIQKLSETLGIAEVDARLGEQFQALQIRQHPNPVHPFWQKGFHVPLSGVPHSDRSGRGKASP